MAEPPAAAGAATPEPPAVIISSAASQTQTSLLSPVDDTNPASGPRKTPFGHPAPSVVIPEESPLTTDQQTAYNSLLNTVATWTTIPTSSDPEAEHTPLTDPELIWLTRQCLLRYLRASQWSVQTAQTRLLSTMLWRRTYGLVSPEPSKGGPKIVSEYISIESETGKQWLLGYDNSGRPCHYLNPSRQNTKKSDRQIEHLVYMLERTIDLLPPGQETLCLLINFAETSSGQGASIGQGKQTMSILQNHYPERLGRALLCNLPWHIWAFMKVITPFIDPLTRQKLVYNDPLKNHVPAIQLVKSHGGELDFEYDHSVYWPALIALAEQRRAAMRKRWEAGGRRVGESELYLRGGTDVCLRNEEEGRLSREKGSLRGRSSGQDDKPGLKREKSVGILEEGKRISTGDVVEDEKQKEVKAENKPAIPSNDEEGEVGEALKEKVEPLSVKENDAHEPTAAA